MSDFGSATIAGVRPHDVLMEYGSLSWRIDLDDIDFAYFWHDMSKILFYQKWGSNPRGHSSIGT